MRSSIKFLIVLLFLTNSVYASFNNEIISANSAAIANASTAVDTVSGIFYNPAITGIVTSDSLFKSDLLFANMYGVSGYNYYSGVLSLSGVSFFKLFKIAFSGYYEDVAAIMSEKNINLSAGTYLLSLFKYLYISAGVSVSYFNISFSGFQEDDNDSAISSSDYLDFGAGIYISYNDFRFGMVSQNLLNKELQNNKVPIRIGVMYDMSKYASLISMDFEMVKNINSYNRSWVKIGSFELGKNIYPLFKFGFQKRVKNILTLRIGLRDFKFTGGVGVAIKGFELNYAFINNNIGVTHLIGVSIKRL